MTPSRRSRPLLALAAAPALLVGGLAGAQDPAAPAANPLAGLSAERLQPGTWTYRTTMTRGGESVELAQRSLTVQPATGAAEPAWLILDVTEARGQTMTDSLLVRRSDLSPLRRAATMGPLQLQTTFGRDSVTGSLSAPDAPPVAIGMASEPALVANTGMLESALTLLPLRPGWTGEVRQLVPNPNGMMVVPLQLTVTGEDTVQVPAGSFPAWVVTASSAGTEQRLWLSRADGRVLRIAVSPPQVPDLVYETVLVESAAASR